MKRPLLRFLGGLLFAATCSFSSFAATVPVEVTMLHGSAASQVGGASGGEVSRREVMYLVLDYSFSMTSNRDGGTETRWKKLVHSLRETVKSVKPGTEVRIAWIGGNREKEDPVVIRTDLDRAKLRSLVETRGTPPSGNNTPLFATLRRVCGEAKELVGQGCSVVVNVFSDGESSELPIWRSRESWTKEQIAELDANFAGLFSDARFKTCLVWINPSQTPSDDRLLGEQWRRLPAAPSLYSVSVQPTPVRVELTENAPPGSLAYGFFVPDGVWDKMKGKWAKFQLLKDGKPVGNPKPIQIKDSQTCSLDVPDALLKGEAAGGLSIALADLPQPEGTVIDDPAAVDLVVSAPKRLTVSAVRPADGTVLKEGDEVRFSVVATAGAICEWSFGDGQTGVGPEAAHTYANAGTYTAKVLVRKDGFEPAGGISREVKGIEVVRAAVVLGPFDSPAVGKKAVFRCKGEGPVSGYTWFVDGSPFAGKDSNKKDSSELEWVFQETGNHSVWVRADLGRGLGSVRSEEKTVSVGVAPFIRIEAPVSGSSSVVGEPVRLSLKAEGGVADVEWRISGPDAKTVPSPAAVGAEWIPEKPGDYTIRAVDKAGKAEPSGEVVVKIRPKDVRLAISADISDGMTVPTGEDFLLKAETKGVGSVRWSVVDDEKGTTNALGSVKTDLSGNAAKTWHPDPKEGDGARWIVAEDEAGAAEPVSVLVNLETEAELSIEKPSDYHPVAFGTPVELAAKADGAVENIRWFVDGKEIKGKGNTASFTPVLERGVPEKLFKVHAEACKPGDPKDRPSLRTAVRTVVASCPALQPRIDLQKKDWDVAAPVQFKVVSAVGRIGEVVWSFGDGTPDQTAPGDAHSHLFAKEGDYAVSARAVCADCGESFPVAAVPISVRCPPLAPVVLEVSPAVDIGAPASFVARHAGKASEYRWTFGDNASTNTPEPQVSHAYAKAGTYTASAVAVCASCGKEFASDPATVDVACPDLRPEIVCTGPNGAEGASFGRNKRVEMLLRVRPGTEGNVEGVRWTFGDGTEEPTGARTSTHHEYAEYASNVVVRVDFSCRQCGKPYRAEKALAIEGQPPKAAFCIEPERDRYSVNGVVEFRDTSDGDVDRCVWTTNGAYFATCGQGEAVRFDAPGRPSDVLVGMTAENDALAAKGDARATSAVSPPKKLRFRWGLLAAALFAVAGGLLLYGLKVVLSGNAIRDCTSYSWVGEKPVAVGNQQPARQFAKLGHIEHFPSYWKFPLFFYRPKHVAVPLENLLKNKKKDGAGWSTQQLARTFAFRLRNGKPFLHDFPEDMFYRRAQYEDVLNPADDSPRYFVFEERLQPKRWLFVVVQKPTKSKTALRCSILLFLGSLAVVGAVLWAVTSFAL